MSPNGSEASASIPERFANFLAQPLPSVEAMSSTDRIAWVTTAKEAINAGVQIPEDRLKFGITLITMDRAEAAKAARSAGATARKVSKSLTASDVAGKIAGMSDEDAADAL